jgi:hypothetical protein
VPEAYLIFWFLFAIVLVLVALWGIKQVGPKTRRVGRGLYDEQMEVDLRLTYKRFKQLYPFSQISYQDYKKLQMERAFRRAVSSEKNKRMVR